MQELYNYQPYNELEDTQANKQEENFLLSIPSQLFYGFLEGLTTLPIARWANAEPTNTVDQIANSLGHLMGFVGINPIGIAGKVASKLFVKSTMGKYLAGFSKHTRMPSLPMYLGNKISNKINQIGLTPALEAMEFTRKNPILKDMAYSAVNLGSQMAVGGAPIYDWSLGAIEDRMKSGVMGMLFGAGNSLIGNTFTRGGRFDINPLKNEEIQALMKADKQLASEAIKASDFRNGLVRAIVSGLVFSTPSLVQGAPLPIVLYDTALNAFFGYKESPHWVKQARAISEQFADAPHLLLDPEGTIKQFKGADVWDNLDKRTKETLQEMADIQLGGLIKNAQDEKISIPGVKVGEAIREVYKNLKVVPNDAKPKEGEIREWEYKKIQQTYKIQDLIHESIVDAAKNNKEPTDEYIADYVRKGLVEAAKESLGITSRLGTYKLFETLDNMESTIREGLSNKSNFIIDKTYKDNGLSSMFTEALDNIVVKSFKDEPYTEETFTDRYVDIIKMVSKYAKDKTLTYDQFKNELNMTYDIVPDKSFRKAYVFANQSVPRYELTYDNGGIRRVADVTERGTVRPVSYQPKPLIHDMLDGDVYEFSTVNDYTPIHDREGHDLLLSHASANGFKKSYEGIYAHLIEKLYKAKIDKGTETHNLAFYSGHKDQSKFLVGKFLITPEEASKIIEERGDIKLEENFGFDAETKVFTLKELYEAAKKRFTNSLTDPEDNPERVEELSKIFEHSFANNIVFLEKFHNRTLSNIAENGIITKKAQKKWMLEPFTLMKRTQGLNSRQVRFNANDIAEALLDREEALKAKSASKTSQEGSGDEETEKPILDMAERKSKIQEVAKALGDERYIILNSINSDGDSTHGMPWVNDYKFKVRNKDGTIGYKPYDAHLDGGQLMRDDIFEAMLTSIGEDIEVKGAEVGAFKGVTIHQGNGIQSGIFSKKAIFKAPKKLSDWMRAQNIHSIEYDTTMKVLGNRKGVDYKIKPDGTIEFLETPTIYTRKWDSNTYLMSDETYKLNKPHRMLKQLFTNIWSDTPEGVAALNSMLEYFKDRIEGKKSYRIMTDENGNKIEVDRLSYAIEKFLKNDLSEDDFIHEALLNNEVGIVDRLAIFLSNHDSKSWRFMRDEIFDKELDNEYKENEENDLAYFKDFGIQNKLFESIDVTPAILASVNSIRNYTETALKRYLMNEILKPKVKEAMTSTLTPQFSYVTNHIRRGEIYYGRDAAKQIIDFKTKKTLGEAFKEAKRKNKDLELVIIRAPADSPSGIRVVKLKGFIDAPGTGAYVHPDEYYNLGGADNDIDKITTYFSLPEEVKTYYKTKANQWYDSEGIAIEAKQNPEYLEPRFPTIVFDSLSNAIVNLNAYKGVHILGAGLNHTNRMLTIHDWVAQKHNGEQVITIYADDTPENKAAFELIKKANEINGYLGYGWEGFKTKKEGKIAIKYLAKLNSKDVISRHQRDIVNYAADASNGDPVKDVSIIKSYVNRDMWIYPNGFNPKEIPGFHIYTDFNNNLYKRLSALDSIYADRNNYEKEILPNGRAVIKRYNIRQILEIARDYAAEIDNNFEEMRGGVSGYMYRVYEKLGRQAEKFLSLPETNYYSWIGNASAVRKLISQVNDFFKKNPEGAKIAEFFFGKKYFGLAFSDSEYTNRARTAIQTLEAKREEIEDSIKYRGLSPYEIEMEKLQEQAEEIQRQVNSMLNFYKKEPYKPNFVDVLKEHSFKVLLSDLRANDIIDLASIWHVISKGKIALENNSHSNVILVRDVINDLTKIYSDVRKAKAEGDKNIENEWVLKVNEIMDTIPDKSLREFAEALLISSVRPQKKSFATYTYPTFKDLKELITSSKSQKFLKTIYDTKSIEISPESAYFYYSNMSENEIRNFVMDFPGNSDKLYKAIINFKEQGKDYFSSGFNDAIARLPFINKKTIYDLFHTYQTIIDFANKNLDTVAMTTEETKKFIEKEILDGKPYDAPLLKAFDNVSFTAKLTGKQLDVYDSLKERLKIILKNKPYLISTLQGHFINWQMKYQANLPVTLKDITLPQLQKFVDYLEKKAFDNTFKLKGKAWVQTPQDFADTVNFYDTKTNLVTMVIGSGKNAKIVKVEVPSSRVTNSILVIDGIQNELNARIKEIEKFMNPDGDDEIKVVSYKTDADGLDLLDEKGQRIPDKDIIVINPSYIKAQIPYEDYQKLFEYALSSHEAKSLRGMKKEDAYVRYLKNKLNEALNAYRDVENKVYSITSNNKTRKLKAYEIVLEIQRFFQAANQKGYRLINDPYHYRRLFKNRFEDKELGFGIPGFEESRLIRVTDFIEKMTNDIFSGKTEKYTNMGLNVWQLINWNNDIYHMRFKVSDNNYQTIERQLNEVGIKTGTDVFWYEYAKMVERYKSLKKEDGSPLYPFLHNPPKEFFDIPRWYREGYFPHREHTKSVIRERMQAILKVKAPNTEEYRKAQLWLINDGNTELTNIEDTLKDILFDKKDDKKYARITASVSGHLKSRNGDLFIPGYRRDYRVYEGYLKDITKQLFNTMMVAVHKHNMARMQKESLTGVNKMTYEEATKLRMFLDIRMLDVLGYPSQFPDSYVDALKLDGTFYHKLTNDYWIRKKYAFVDRILRIEEDTPDELRARKINKTIASLSNLEATWAMMPLLASPKFMITNRFSGAMTTIVNAGMEYFLKAHKMSEVTKYVNHIRSYSDMVDFVSQHGGIESFIKNELVLSQNVKLGDVTAFVKDVVQFYKEGKDVPLVKMYELAKQRGLTQEFVDKAAYFMRASEIKNRVYTWFAHYMKAHDTLYRNSYDVPKDRVILAGDPWLVAIANKGVAATQYLYDSLNRPAFARTALGKMLTRFQLYTYNNLRWRKQLMDAARYEDWRSADGKRLANLVAMDMMVLTLATFFPGTIFSASLNQPYGWVKDLVTWLFGDEKEREKAFFGSLPYPANIVQPVLPPFTRFLINPIVALFDLEKFTNTLVWGLFPFGRMVNETRKSIDNPLLMPEKSFGIPMFTLVKKIQKDYKRREEKEQEENPAPVIRRQAS